MSTSSVPPHVEAAFAEFSTQSESSVLFALESGAYKTWPEREGAARAWLALKAEARNNATSAARDAREARTLAIAEEALSIAKDSAASASRAAAAAEEQALAALKQARWAKWAAIIATVAAIATASINIHELIAWLQK